MSRGKYLVQLCTKQPDNLDKEVLQVDHGDNANFDIETMPIDILLNNEDQVEIYHSHSDTKVVLENKISNEAFTITEGSIIKELINTDPENSNTTNILLEEGENEKSSLTEILCQEVFDHKSSNEKCSENSENEDFIPLSETSSSSEDSNLVPVVKRARWSKTNKEKWKVSVNKTKKREGLDYETKKGKLKQGKNPKTIDCTKCRYKCSQKFDEELRNAICRDFWKLDYNRQKDFILSTVESIFPKTRRARTGTNKPKSSSRFYNFIKGGIKERVCKNFYLKTLCISHGPVDLAFSGLNEVGIFNKHDGRGRHTPANKTSEELLQKVKAHIESFPKTESHYCRAATKREYLDQNLSITKMYALYVEQCKSKNESYVSQITYRRTFCTQYNLAFFKPKKDQCLICENYKSKKSNEDEYKAHIIRKNEAYEVKKLDKERAITDKSFISASFDLQSVLQIPSSEVSLMYYSRKICLYNLTIYEAAPPNTANCYAWTEINGQRGSSEIGTALHKWFQMLPENVNEFSLFSDTCSGQNRNQHIAALFLYCVRKIKNLNVIEHKFMEKGHSFMEVDSMHSSIETAKKGTSVYSIHGWLNIFKKARSKRLRSKSEKYNVTELRYNDFFDLKKLSSSFLKNRNMNQAGEKVNWLKIKVMRYEKEHPQCIFYKYNHSDLDYDVINIASGRRQNINGTVDIPDNLCQLYNKSLPISCQKKNDLLKLCNSGAIPEEFHGWYKSLKTIKKKDVNPEPSCSSDSETE